MTPIRLRPQRDWRALKRSDGGDRFLHFEHVTAGEPVPESRFDPPAP